MRSKKAAIVCGLVLLLATSLPAQRRRGHDPLTAAETDELREVAQEPAKRIPMYLKYAGARLQAIEQLRGDPKLAEGRGHRIHDLLEDFTALVDELDDNVNMYATRKDDIRKPLGQVITAESEWQTKLRGLKEGSGPNAPAEIRDYSFVLDTAMDSVNSSITNAREVQEEIAKDIEEQKQKEKEKKKQKDKSND